MSEWEALLGRKVVFQLSTKPTEYTDIICGVHLNTSGLYIEFLKQGKIHANHIKNLKVEDNYESRQQL